MKLTLKQLLDAKGHDLWSISPDASVFEAVRRMADKGIGLLLVMDDGRAVGVISERDYARKVILEGRSSKQTPVSDIMTARIVYGHPDQTVEEGLSVMTQNHFRHLPVIDGDSVLGMLSIGDLVKAVIDGQNFKIEQLEGYISG